MQNLPPNKKIILFDGVCNLCNSAVQFIIKHDKKDVFRFVALQSELGKEILAYIGIDTKNIDSIVLYEPGVAYYYKSDAALQIANSLG
jgi:predicted DCC family thiol-disulfide oxidoreductase YuxK